MATKIIEAKDFLANDIKVGDQVAYCELGYRNFKISYIMKITPCMVFLNSVRNEDKKYWVKQEHEQVIKVENE